jgi:hypothetical protein
MRKQLHIEIMILMFLRVFSKNIQETPWQNSRVVKEINPDEIAQMKRKPGKTF